MALTNRSKFIYGFEVTELNNAIDFKESISAPERRATLKVGYYSLSGLLKEIERAMEEADTSNDYEVSAIRNVGIYGDVRVRIKTNGSYLKLLFGTGSRASSSVANLIGFLNTDYSGSILYQASTNAGTHLLTRFAGYTYIPAEFNRRVFGSVNVSASGLKEAIVHNIQKFVSVNFKYEEMNDVLNYWVPFFEWAIRQRPFEFVPEISNPNFFYDVTLESTPSEGKGLGFQFKEMLPSFPNLYEIGNIKMRINEG